MKLPSFISNNLILKITSLNSVVIFVKLAVSVFIQRFLAISVGEAGIALIGQLRSLMDMITSFSTLGTSDGIIKYVSEFKDNKEALQKLFSTTFVFTTVASLAIMVFLFFAAPYLSEQLFGDETYTFVIKILSLIIPLIGLRQVCFGVVNGLMAYKVYASAELAAYLLSSLLLVITLFSYNLRGVLVAIAITPLFYLVVLLSIYGKVIMRLIKVNTVGFRAPLYKNLLGFSAMSISAHLLFNYVEIDLRNIITKKLNVEEAGYWTAMTNLSKNYMMFTSSVFTIYVLPKFSNLNSATDFRKEVLSIYKTLLPLFGIGLLLIYLLRNAVIEFVYPEFSGLEPLFKWQLLADFVRLAAMVVAFRFLAKKMVVPFISTEIFSVLAFYVLAVYLVDDFGTQGVVIANFIRYILYFAVVLIVVVVYFTKEKQK